jgi:hypothetical protein
MKKLLSLLLVLSVCLSVSTVYASAESSGEAAESAAVLNMMGALEGSGGGSLDLSGTLTRAQFCKIAVVVLGKEDAVGQYSGYTIFPDVPSSHWASGYVNLAVRSAGIISGYPDGKFGPNDVITYGQAVTVLMRMLGYTSADVGSVWPSNYLNKAAEAGLSDGLSLSGSASMTRGDAAILFANVFNCKMNGSEKTYAESISNVTAVKNVFLVSSNAESDDGTEGAVKIAGAAAGTYLPVNQVPEELLGKYGTLLLNAAGEALTFVPADTGKTVVSSVSAVTGKSITCSDGTKITLTSSTKFYLNGETAVFTDSWVDVNEGMLVSAYYSEGGAVQYVLVMSSSSGTEDIRIVTGSTYSLPSSAVIYRNGVKAEASDITKYDVVSYDADYGVYNVSDKRVTGRYEAAYPNAQTPSTVTVLGEEFEVLDCASEDLAGYEIGESLTLLLTVDYKVAGVVSNGVIGEKNLGVVTSASGSSVTVELSNGVTVSGKTDSDYSDYLGCLMSVSSSKLGYISLGQLGAQTSNGLLDLSSGTLGTSKLSKSVKIYECVGSSAVKEIPLDDLIVNTVSSLKVKYTAYDLSGSVNLLLLDDATGDVYEYGIIKTGSVTSTSNGMSATNTTYAVTNGNGTSETLTGGASGLYTGVFAGIASTPDGHLAGYKTLNKLSGISRSSFEEDSDGHLYVKTDIGLIRVSDDVQVYIDATGQWTTLAKARTASDNLTALYDSTPDEGKVRVVIAY